MTVRLHVIRTRYPHWGAHSGIHQYLRHLNPEHFQVELHEAADGDDDFPLRNPQVRKRLRGLVQRGMSWYKLSDLWAETRALRRCWRGRTDLVHYLDGEHSAQYLPALPRRGVPVVASFHQPPELLGTVLSDRAVRRLDRAIAVSPTQVPWLAERLGEDCVDLILHGIDTEFFRPGARQMGKGPFRCITVGHYLRDFAAIREAVHRLVGQDVEFHVVTNRDTGLEGLPGVHRHQDLNDKRLLALYQQADALFLPVTSSTANNALLEGIACGLPVISTRMASIEAYVPGEEAILVEGNDPEELARAILRLRDDPRLARAMGRRARARAEELAWQRIAPQYAAVYDLLAGDLTPHPPLPSHSRPPGEGAPPPKNQNSREPGGGAPSPGGRECDGRGGQGVRSISIILPAHNAAATLPETLASLQAQTFPHWEAIIIDDASTDATPEIARQAAATDPRLRVIPGPGHGPSAARNEGIAHASADWLLFLDADDLLAPEHLERIAAALKGGDHDGALCGWVRFAPDGRRGPEQLPEEGDLFPVLACYCAPAIHSCVIRRSLVEEVGRFDPSLRTCEDWDLWQRLARAGARFARVPEILALYRMVPESASHDPRRLLEDGLRVIDRGHAPDPRVPRPSPRWAAGQPTTGLSGARLRFATWAAGLALGRGEDARPLLEKVARDHDPGLTPADVAGTLFQAALLPGCRVPEDWVTLWPELDSAITDFLAALEAASGTKHLAALTRREMECLAIERSTASRPFTLGSVHAVEVELTEPLRDIPVPPPAERLHVIAHLEGETLGSIELPIVLEPVPSMLLADALADRFAWTILGRFLERQRRGSLSWESFLQEIWGRPGWPMSRFYDPASATNRAPRVHPDSLLSVEVSGELPSVKLSGPTDVALHVGGATIGRLRLPTTKGVMEAHALRVFLTATSGFELCRAAVREALLGQPLTAPGTLRDRLTAAALRSRPRDHRGVLLAHHPDAPLSSPASRLAFLPAAALPELLDLADATGQRVASLPEQPPWALYAPDCFAEPIASGSSHGFSTPPPSTKLYGRRHFETLFATSPDPWRYTSPYEETKYEQTLSLLPDGEIRNALELACAEGHFTVRLAPRVGRLVAADISRIALERATSRCGDLGNVEFAHVDLTRDSLPEGFDLIVCSEVLYFAGSVVELREVARRLAAALLPEGYLLTAHASLVVDEPDRPGFDWDFPFGARVIGEALVEAGGLRLVRELRTPLYRVQLFQKGGPAGAPRIEEADHGPLPPQIAQRVLWNGGSPRRSESPPDLRTWKLPILLYHRIAPEGATAKARYRVTPEAFEEQLRFLRDSGYHTPHLGDWLRAMEAKEPLPGRAVLFTFDDGYRDFAEHAWPLLRRYGFTALVFLVADAVGGTNEWDEAYGERLPLLSWEEIRRLHAEGVELGSHTATHRPLTSLSATDVVREVARSRAVLTRGLGGPVEAIAYPHGAADEVVRHLTGACGYRSGLTCNPAHSGFDDPPLALPRLEVRGDASFADFVALLGGG